MQEDYKEIYHRLVESYYENHFEETFQSIVDGMDSKEHAREVLSVLCGVNTPTQEDDFKFMQEIVHSIIQSQVRNKLINKINKCSEDCEVVEGKTKCQSVCPINAILKDPMSNDKWIDEKSCIYCGRCVTVCKNHNYIDTPQFMPLVGLLKLRPVVAIVAPAIAGQFGKDVTLDQLREAFVKVGFTDMIEVAMGADILSIKEAMEFNEHVNKEGDFMISSCCCPVWVTLLKKVYHQLIPDFSPSISPMIAVGRIAKKLKPNAKVVFVGPCLAKKAEAKEEDLAGAIDFVLTFEELKVIFEILDIHPEQLKGIPSVDYASTGGRLYARSGGVSQAVSDIVDQIFPKKRDLFRAVQVDGVKDCRAMLEQLEKGEIKASFIEGMACPGGCVGGPKAIIDKEEGRKAVDETAYESAIKIPVNSQVIGETLSQLGIKNVKELVYKGSMFEREF